jgi:1-acyl-sn-glycerol-3-phosphate acyltransferase
MSSQYSLLKQRRFGPFFVTQFLGAFNDNLYKNAMMILLAFNGAAITSMSSDILIQLSGGLFILPFFLFSATAGQLADKIDKAKLARFVKLFEITIMIIGGLGFYYKNLYLLMGALTMMGLHSTVFGPVKYAILPQHLMRDELVGGNGLVEMGTNVAILLGTVLGGILIGRQNGPVTVAAAAIVIAVVGYLTSRAIPSAPPLADAAKMKINWNPLTETWRNLKFTSQNRTVWLSILGISWFWLYGLVFLSQFPNLTKDFLYGGESVVSLLLTIFSVGVGIGSLLCERLSGHKVEIGLVPFGAFGLTAFGVDFYFASAHLAPHAVQGALAFLGDTAHIRLIADLCLIGMFGGFYIVPLYALIQIRSAPEHRSRIIAGNNIVNAAAMVFSVGMVIGMRKAGLAIPQVLLATSLLNAGVVIYIFTLVPEFLMRFLIWMLIHTIYRLNKEGVETIPEEGGVLLVCNHVSYVDALVIAAACQRPIRFVVDHRIFKIPLLNFIFRTGKAIPIAPAKEAPQLLEQAYDTIAAELADGNLVCIFPEGGLTSDGEIGEFKSGVQKIVERTPVPVIPLALCGLWGSLFSRQRNSAIRRLGRGIFSAIALKVGSPVPSAEVTPTLLRTKVAELRGDRK